MIAANVEGWVEFVLFWLSLLFKAFALIDAAYRKHEFYSVADKQSKVMWVVILAVTVAVQALLQSPLQFLNLIGTVAAGVYLADVRPALRALRHP